MTFGERSNIEEFHNEMIKKDEDMTANFGANITDPGDALNLRGKLWRVICDIDNEKRKALESYEEKR